MEPMQEKLASSQCDFGYTEQFCIPGVTSVFFSSCDSVVVDTSQAEDWKKIVSMQMSDKELKLKIYKELLNINRKANNLIKILGKIDERSSS